MFSRVPNSLNITFDTNIYNSDDTLRIGYFDSYNIFESCEPVKRAILTSYGHLTSMGYELVRIT